MYTKKMLAAVFAAIIAFPVLTSCDPEPEVKEETKIQSGVYVLNQGKYKSNNASISYFDFNTNLATGDIFLDKNDRGLGDSGQDMIIYGSKMYASIYGSGVIEVMDSKTAKSIKSVSLEDGKGGKYSPRTLTAANGKVYIVLYDGHVAAMDTAKLAVEKIVKVGLNPDGSVIANNKLYVANTGGMNRPERDKTVSVIDLAKFEEIKKVEVNLNPEMLGADSKGNVYVKSNGDYANVKGKFQRITPDYKVTDIDLHNIMGFDIVEDKAYIYSFEYDENWQATNTKIMVYDLNQNKLISENIAKVEIKNTPYCIDVNPKTKDVYLGATDYVNNGKMYCFSSDGNLKYNFTVGLNPTKTVFLYKN